MDYPEIAVLNPQEIETRSMGIIESEMGPHGFTPTELKIIKRVIHTTADFEYKDLIVFHNNPIDKALTALRNGRSIYADTRMAASGINAGEVSRWGGEVVTAIQDASIASEAKVRGITRSMVAMEQICKRPEIGIYAIGNAPTALFVLMEHIRQGLVKPDLIVGAPIGFVGAEESKEALLQMDVPAIVIRGRKGGSPVAATILNALLYVLREEAENGADPRP